MRHSDITFAAKTSSARAASLARETLGNIAAHRIRHSNSRTRRYRSFFIRSPAACAEYRPIQNHRRANHEICTRSEEHTSELKSIMRISYAVFCLQKKKNTER